MTDVTLTVLSLGGGVQSTVMALMAARGEITPMPDLAIWADTQSESRGVVEHVEWLAMQLPYPVVTVTAGSCEADVIAGTNSTGQVFTTIPAFRLDGGMGRRQCTAEYKLRPIYRAIRDALGLSKGQRVPGGTTVEQWIGISTDEEGRAKDARESWALNRWPLIEAGMSRRDCLAWWREHYGDRPLVRSACVFCPMQHDREWRQMKEGDSDAWERACAVDDALNARGEYLHRSCKPLRSLDLTDYQLDLFAQSSAMMCDGGCFT